LIVSDPKARNEIVSGQRLDGENLLATLRGEVDLHNSPELRSALLAVITKHRFTRLILNLSQVPYMDSSAIAVLVEMLQKVKRGGGKICLTNLQPRVKGLLEIARLNTVFVLASDEDEAKTK
jgi:anti-sigma B factor antagonist